VKAQIRIAEGGRIGQLEETGIPEQAAIPLNGHALQCRITTENPENSFIPDYGRITAYRGAFGFGIRVDGGTAYSGAVVTRYYDPLLEKVTAWAPSPPEVIARMVRALREYRIRGVATNLAFLEAVLNHPKFRAVEYTTRFIDETPELFRFTKRRDRATKLLSYIADVSVNGHPEAKGRPRPPANARRPEAPRFAAAPVDGAKQLFDKLGPKAFAEWMRGQRRVLVTDTTMRDAHQSLLATRMRSFDIVGSAEACARGLPQLLSLECWGGATFDVAMRFLTEDPWERLAALRERIPNLLLQMLLRGANGVGYTNYPDNVVRYFVQQAAAAGIDLFRIFDCFNWIENMRVSIDAVGEAGKLAEGAICYTGDILDPSRAKYSLAYYVDLAKQLERAGCHILGIKDMAGVLKPAAARVLVKALKEAVGTAAAPAHARHRRHRGRQRARGHRHRRRCGRCRHGHHVRHDLPTLPRFAGGGAAPHRARHQARSRGHPADQLLLGGCAHSVHGLRKRSQVRRLRGLSARDARRPVHQHQGAGARPRPGDALARSREGLSGRQRSLRRHRQGHALRPRSSATWR
jgi:pyruvate carboxylase